MLFVSQKFAIISGLDSMTRPEGPGECQFGNFNAHHVICIIGFLVMENSAAVIHAFVIEFANLNISTISTCKGLLLLTLVLA